MFLTGVVITKNVAHTLTACLKSLQKVVDEIIIVDSGSSDQTLEIAKQFNCNIIQTNWLGYGRTKNLGNQAAKHPYILSIDSDEELSAELIVEILEIKRSIDKIYSFKRLNNFCGKWIKFGAWYPDIKIRIFPKDILWNDAHSHEQLLIPKESNINLLNGCLNHYAYNSLYQFKEKTVLYAKLGSIQKSKQPIFILILKVIFSPLIGFIKSYFLKLGFLDGYFGLLISYYNAQGTFLKYLWALKQKFRSS